jgi:outer membrane protein OmpA-like peptidoglycan-associated protein
MTTAESLSRKPGASPLRHIGLSLAGVLLATGCAPSAYIVLLEQDDGRTGSVVVSHAGRSASLDKAGAGLSLTADGPTPVTVSPAQIKADFGAAMAAQPSAPQTFILYFEGSSASLTPASAKKVDDVRKAMSARRAPDVSIIGHTDRAGENTANEALGLTRAQVVRDMLAKEISAAVAVEVTSHGERNPLIPTKDGVAEPGNRRVELTIR